MKLVQFSLPLLLCAFAEAAISPRQGSNETVVHLAVHPQCGPLSGNVSDVNAGLDLAKIKTIVSFGVRVHSVRFRECKDVDWHLCMGIGFVYGWRKAGWWSARASRRDPSKPLRGRSLNKWKALGGGYRGQYQCQAYGLRCKFSIAKMASC